MLCLFASGRFSSDRKMIAFTFLYLFLLINLFNNAGILTCMTDNTFGFICDLFCAAHDYSGRMDSCLKTTYKCQIT